MRMRTPTRRCSALPYPFTMAMHVYACLQTYYDASAVLLLQSVLHCLKGGNPLNMSCHPDMLIGVTAEAALTLKVVAAALQPNFAARLHRFSSAVPKIALRKNPCKGPAGLYLDHGTGEAALALGLSTRTHNGTKCFLCFTCTTPDCAATGPSGGDQLAKLATSPA